MNPAPFNICSSLRTKSLLTLGEDVFYVSECKGEGGFAKVFAASKQETEGDCWCSKMDTEIELVTEMRKNFTRIIDGNDCQEN